MFGITTGSFPSITETQEFVVPKSIPIILLIFFILVIKNFFLFNLIENIMPNKLTHCLLTEMTV